MLGPVKNNLRSNVETGSLTLCKLENFDKHHLRAVTKVCVGHEHLPCATKNRKPMMMYIA